MSQRTFHADTFKKLSLGFKIRNEVRQEPHVQITPVDALAIARALIKYDDVPRELITHQCHDYTDMD